MLIVLTSIIILFYPLRFLVYLIFRCSGVYAMGGCLKGINHDKRKYITSLNICKRPSLIRGGMEVGYSEQRGK